MAVEGIIGIKLGMTQIFAEDGNLVGCTVLQAGPCVVVQMRTKQKDGYEAAQLGLVEFVKPQRVNKALTGHFKKANVPPMKVMREVRVFEHQRRKQGQRICRRREALALRGRRCHARFDVSPRTGRHWRQFVSITCLEESTFSGAYGQRQRNRQEFEGDQSGYRRKPAVGAGIGAGAGGAIHFHQESA